MANDKAAAAFVRPQVKVNLAAQYPLYDGGDARTGKIGTKGLPIHGILLGMLDLPSVLPNADGEVREWRAFVFELLQPAPACPPGKDAETKMYQKGDKIALTVTKTLERYVDMASHPQKVFEVLVEPEISQTKAGQSLWIYPMIGIVAEHKRLPIHSISTSDFFAEIANAAGPATGGQLGGGQANANGAPFAGARS